jgi:hypothetical protein
MTRDQAQRIVGNQQGVFVRNMARALAMHSWNNTAAEWERLEAACIVLGKRAPKRSLEILASYKKARKAAT